MAAKHYEVNGTACVSFSFTARIKAKSEAEAETIAKQMIIDAKHDQMQPMDWFVDNVTVDYVEEDE